MLMVLKNNMPSMKLKSPFEVAKLLFFLLLLSSSISVNGQNPDAEAIKKRMTTIRQTTDWKDKDEAAKANAEISKLAKELMMTKSVTRDQVSGVPEPGQMLEEDIDFKLSLWNRLWADSRDGKQEVDLAKPLREKIIEEYKEDSDHSVKNPEILNNTSILVINMSMKGVEAVIEQMPMFKNISTLVVICEKPEGVDLETIFTNASEYPLEKLCVLNFGSFVTNLPESLGQFKSLGEINLIGNNLYSLPNSLSELHSLERLYADMNPLYSVIGQITGLNKLVQLGIKGTNINEEEIKLIETALPECQILR